MDAFIVLQEGIRMLGKPGWEDTITTAGAASRFSIRILNDAPDNPEAPGKGRGLNLKRQASPYRGCCFVAATILASEPASLSQTGC